MDFEYTYRYYLLGIHAVRITIEDDSEIWWERYDKKTKKFIFDFSLLRRMLDDLEGGDMTETEFLEYIATDD